MKKVVATFILSATAAQLYALKPCEELKSEIAAKIEANGVKNYQLEIVAAEDIKDQTVVGNCEGGKKKITYKKEEGEPQSKAPKADSGKK